jgi:hypothetical protein
MLAMAVVYPAAGSTTRGMGKDMAISPDLPRRNNGQAISSDCADGEVRGHAADGAFRAPAEEELSLANELVLERLLARSTRIVMTDVQP